MKTSLNYSDMVKTIKDIGIKMSNTLSFTDYIETVYVTKFGTNAGGSEELSMSKICTL